MYSICLLFNHCCSFIFFSVPPLFVIEFLHRVVDTFTEYFNSCTEMSIKENVVIVFEVRRYMKHSKYHSSWKKSLKL